MPYMCHLRGIFVSDTYVTIVLSSYCSFFLTCMHSNVGLYVDHSNSAVEHLCVMSQVNLLGVYVSNVKCLYICVPSYLLDIIGFI